MTDRQPNFQNRGPFPPAQLLDSFLFVNVGYLDARVWDEGNILLIRGFAWWLRETLGCEGKNMAHPSRTGLMRFPQLSTEGRFF